MKEMNIQFHKTRPHNPFDDGAKARLHRMGLLRIDGSVDEATLNALSRAYSGLGKKEWKGGSMPFAQLIAVLPLRDVACSLRVPSNSNDLKCNKDENETVIAHRSDCGLFLSPNRKE